MKINGWHIDGFGVFADFDVRDIAPGLTVFEGHNGAGKSTLFTFVQTMLFGPSTSKSDPKYDPLNGGQHAGSLQLTSSDGQEYMIYRRLAKRGDITIRGNDEAVEPAVLNQLLGHCDYQMFKAVFAFGLSELQSLGTMSHEDTKRRLALAGLSGTGRSPQDVLKLIEDRKGALLKQRGTKAEINVVLNEIQGLNAKLKNARAASSQYAEVQQRESLAIDERARIEEEMTALRRQQDRYQRLIDTWPTWLRFNQARLERNALILNDVLASVGDDVDALYASIDRYEEWQRDRENWRGKQRTAQSQVAEHLRNLGPEWDEGRLVAFDRSIPRREEIRQFEARLRSSAEALRQARAEVEHRRETASESMQNRELAHSALIDLGEPESQENLDHQRSSLTRLRATLTDAIALESNIRADEQRLADVAHRRESEASKAAGAAPIWLAPAAGLAAVVLVLLGIWLLVDGAVATGGVLLAVAVSLVLVGVWARERRSQAGKAAAPLYIEREIDQLTRSVESDRAQLGELNQAIATHADVIGLSPRPSSIEVEEASSRVDQRGHHWQSVLAKQAMFDHAARLERDASAALSTADQVRQNSLNINIAEQNAWREWQTGAGIPTTLSPATSIDFLQESEEARDHHQAAIEAKSQVTRLSDDLSRLERRLHTVSEAVGEPVPEPGHATILAIEHLMACVNEERVTRRKYAELDVAARTAEQSVTETLGSGDEAATSQELLTTGSLPEWQDIVNQTKARIDTLEAEKTAAIEDGRTAKIERGRLEASGAIATLETELNGLQAEASAAIREWAVLSLAGGLVQRTLAKFERERQPAVLQHASRLFRDVTQGEYQRVSSRLAATGKDVAEIAIWPSSGEPLTATQLSRGTMEQLYLCLRLGLANTLSDETGPLPLLMDDVLVNFDPKRARQVAKVLCQVAEQRQVLLFTCHPRIVNMLQEVNGGCAHYKMGHNGQAGAWHPTA